MVKIGILLLSAVVSGVAIRLAMSAAPALKLVDHPGEHKQHEHSTPFVGGIGLFLAVMVSLLALSHLQPQLEGFAFGLALATVIMFVTGLADDIWRLGFRIRFVIQACAALIMVFVGDVALRDLGGLLFDDSLPLGALSVPFTVFATIGVINALNMIDGMDGMAGSIAFMSLLVISAMAVGAGSAEHVIVSFGLLGGVGAFLYYNLRRRGQSRARVFLGDNGSMLLGLLLASLLIDMSQGESRVIAPVSAVWLLAVPLMDTVGVMLRRVWLGKSPFAPDRYHLHHLMQQAGFRVDDIVAIVAVLQLVLGVAGVGAHALGASEGVLLLAFLALFALYFAVTVRTWRAVVYLRKLHSALGLLPAASCGLCVGQDGAKDARHLIDAIAHELGQDADVHVRIYEQAGPRGGRRYALVNIQLDDEGASVETIRRYVRIVRRRLREHQHVVVRALVLRDPANDPRAGAVTVDSDRRRADRRNPRALVLVAEIDAHVGSGRITDVDLDETHPHPEEPLADGLPTWSRPKATVIVPAAPYLACRQDQTASKEVSKQ